MSDDVLSKILDKVDKISDDMSEMKVTSAKQQISLDTHIRRSDMLERLVSHLDEDKIAPLQEDMHMMKGAYKLLGVVALIITIALGVMKLLGH